MSHFTAADDDIRNDGRWEEGQPGIGCYSSRVCILRFSAVVSACTGWEDKGKCSRKTPDDDHLDPAAAPSISWLCDIRRNERRSEDGG